MKYWHSELWDSQDLEAWFDADLLFVQVQATRFPRMVLPDVARAHCLAYGSFSLWPITGGDVNGRLCSRVSIQPHLHL
jgi:hypothetical protein